MVAQLGGRPGVLAAGRALLAACERTSPTRRSESAISGEGSDVVGFLQRGQCGVSRLHVHATARRKLQSEALLLASAASNSVTQ